MTGPLSSLPQVPDSALPRAVREGTKDERAAYRAALGFERLFVEQLVRSATARTPLVDGPHAGAVDGALADAIVAGGGLGLAAELHGRLQEGRR